MVEVSALPAGGDGPDFVSWKGAGRSLDVGSRACGEMRQGSTGDQQTVASRAQKVRECFRLARVCLTVTRGPWPGSACARTPCRRSSPTRQRFAPWRSRRSSGRRRSNSASSTRPILVTIPTGDNVPAPRRATGRSRRPVATASPQSLVLLLRPGRERPGQRVRVHRADGGVCTHLVGRE